MVDEKRAGYIQLGLVLLFIIGSFGLSKLLKTNYQPPGQNENADRTLVVETIQVSPQPYRISFETTGIVKARNEINVVPQVSGRVVAVHDAFFAGGTFNKNETLFEIEPRDFELDIKRLEADVARARTALEIEMAESKAALSEWQQINGDMPAPDLVARKPQMAEASANLQSAEAQLENSQLDLERTAYVLPFSGRVIASNIAVGQYVMVGQAYGTVFDIASLEVQSSLIDHQLEWLLEAEDPGLIISATYLGKTHRYDAILKRAASSLDVGTRFATVHFGFNDEIVNLLPGVFAEIEIKGSDIEGVTLIPSTALQSQNIVWQVTPENTLLRWEPDIIYMDDEFTAVSGLNEPALIVTSRISGASNGMRVNPIITEQTQSGSSTKDL
jgi:RND family efflux transporter MFP subunit